MPISFGFYPEYPAGHVNPPCGIDYFGISVIVFQAEVCFENLM